MRLYNILGEQVGSYQEWPLKGQGILFLNKEGKPSNRYFTEEGKAIIPQRDLSYKRVVYPPTREWEYNPQIGHYEWVWKAHTNEKG